MMMLLMMRLRLLPFLLGDLWINLETKMMPANRAQPSLIIARCADAGTLQLLGRIVFGVVVLPEGHVERDEALIASPLDGDHQFAVLRLAQARL